MEEAGDEEDDGEDEDDQEHARVDLLGGGVHG